MKRALEGLDPSLVSHFKLKRKIGPQLVSHRQTRQKYGVRAKHVVGLSEGGGRWGKIREVRTRKHDGWDDGKKELRRGRRQRGAEPE
jgi:hypothetical protein